MLKSEIPSVCLPQGVSGLMPEHPHADWSLLCGREECCGNQL